METSKPRKVARATANRASLLFSCGNNYCFDYLFARYCQMPWIKTSLAVSIDRVCEWVFERL